MRCESYEMPTIEFKDWSSHLRISKMVVFILGQCFHNIDCGLPPSSSADDDLFYEDLHRRRYFPITYEFREKCGCQCSG